MGVASPLIVPSWLNKHRIPDGEGGVAELLGRQTVFSVILPIDKITVKLKET